MGFSSGISGTSVGANVIGCINFFATPSFALPFASRLIVRILKLLVVSVVEGEEGGGAEEEPEEGGRGRSSFSTTIQLLDRRGYFRV